MSAVPPVQPGDCVLGIDYGGTATKLLVAREPVTGGEPVAQLVIPTPRAADAATALGELGDRVQEFLDAVPSVRVRCAAVTVAGIIDESGTVVTAANLPWLAGTALGEVLRGRLGFPVYPVHDGRAAALAEAVLGAGRGDQDIYVLVLGTGVGAAHVVGGHVLAGAHRAAGEIGHISQDEHGTRCTCGQRGCLETLIGGAHLARRWQQVLAGRQNSASADLQVSAKDLIAAARTGDPAAQVLVDQATDALARSVLGVIATVDPGCVVIGGGLGQAQDMIVTPTAARVAERATFHRVPPIRPAVLGRWAGAWGAALRAAQVGEVTCLPSGSRASEPGAAG